MPNPTDFPTDFPVVDIQHVIAYLRGQPVEGGLKDLAFHVWNVLGWVLGKLPIPTQLPAPMSNATAALELQKARDEWDRPDGMKGPPPAAPSAGLALLLSGVLSALIQKLLGG